MILCQALGNYIIRRFWITVAWMFMFVLQYRPKCRSTSEPTFEQCQVTFLYLFTHDYYCCCQIIIILLIIIVIVIFDYLFVMIYSLSFRLSPVLAHAGKEFLFLLSPSGFICTDLNYVQHYVLCTSMSCRFHFIR